MSRIVQFFYIATIRLSQLTDAGLCQTMMTCDGAGNLTSLTDVNSHQTQLQWDIDERMTQATRADTTLVKFAYDALHRLCAVTPPNGTQTNTSAINLVGARNWLANPCVETVDNAVSTNPQRWTSSGINPTGQAVTATT